MDDRDRANTKVVPLRRKGQSENGDREHVASKIFAEEDGIGTFSLGNLIPPTRRGAGDDPRGTPPDGFERKQEPDPASGAQNAAADEGPDEFFEQLIAQSSVRTRSDGAPANAPTLPGSAHLPSELTAPEAARRVSVGRLVERLTMRRRDAARTMLGDTTGRTSRRMMRAGALAAAAIAVLASVAGAVLLGHGGPPRPSVRLPEAAQPAPTLEPRPASAAAWAALRAHTKAPGSRRHHPVGPRHRKTAASGQSSSPAAPSVVCCAAHTAQAQPHHYASSPSTSGGSGGGRHARKPGPSGRVSLIGAGTTPSG